MRLAQKLNFNHGRIGRFDWSSDGMHLAIPFEDGGVRVWSVNQSEPSSGDTFISAHNDRVIAACWEPGSERFATGSDGIGPVRIWRRGDRSWKLDETAAFAHGSGVAGLAWSRHGLASGDNAGRICIWDGISPRGTVLPDWPLGNKAVSALVWCKGTLYAASEHSSQLVGFDPRSRVWREVGAPFRDGIYCLAFEAGTGTLAVGSRGKVTFLIEDRVADTFSLDDETPVVGLSFSPRGGMIAIRQHSGNLITHSLGGQPRLLDKTNCGDAGYYVTGSGFSPRDPSTFVTVSDGGSALSLYIAEAGFEGEAADLAASDPAQDWDEVQGRKGGGLAEGGSDEAVSSEASTVARGRAGSGASDGHSTVAPREVADPERSGGVADSMKEEPEAKGGVSSVQVGAVGGLALSRGVEVSSCLAVDDYARALARVLEQSHGEFCMAIFGHWGRGKTHLAKRIEASLTNESVRSKEPPVYEVVWFSAWKYTSRNELWSYLYESFRESAVGDAVSLTRSWPRAARVVLEQRGLQAWLRPLMLLALASIPMTVLVNYAIVPLVSFFGLLGTYRLWKIFQTGRDAVTATPRVSNRSEQLGLQAAVGDDLRALLRAWVDPPVWSGTRWAARGFLWLVVLCSLLLALGIGLGYVANSDSSSAPQLESSGELLPEARFGRLLSSTQDSVKASLSKLLRGEHHPKVALLAAVAAIGLFVPIWLVFGGRGTDRVLLVVDDLDRVSPEEMLHVVESIKLLLEDDSVRERVQVLILVEEELIKGAVRSKYQHLVSASVGLSEDRLVEETLQKIFLSWLRLPPLNGSERLARFRHH